MKEWSLLCAWSIAVESPPTSAVFLLRGTQIANEHTHLAAAAVIGRDYRHAQSHRL